MWVLFNKQKKQGSLQSKQYFMERKASFYCSNCTGRLTWIIVGPSSSKISFGLSNVYQFLMFKMNFPAKDKHTHTQASYQTSISNPPPKKVRKKSFQNSKKNTSYKSPASLFCTYFFLKDANFPSTKNKARPYGLTMVDIGWTPVFVLRQKRHMKPWRPQHPRSWIGVGAWRIIPVDS